ncbi:hypothetical protein [Coralliovum pocilloporae]|uniref:hypothetical protein n=1 Tax=Coralliovum pocilloporae TaxID=3066369 RepID=UPI0033077949
MQDHQIDQIFADILVDRLGQELPEDEANSDIIMAFAEAIVSPEPSSARLSSHEPDELALVLPPTH